VEPWILDYSGDLYGQELSLELYRYLRPERSFDSLEALKEEILHNAEQTKHLLSQELRERNQTI
jgi:riboflavin kinase/FMN adenylyltransferase